MSPANPAQTDPWRWSVFLVLAFGGLACVRLTIPSGPLFDEVHYLPAARALLEDWGWINREHPLLGKLFIAGGMTVFGDTPFGWRIAPLLAGMLALYAAMRGVWHGTRTRFASLACGWLLATGFALFVHARIAMLDVFMVAFFLVALWHCAGAVRQPETGRWRLALAGVALGLAMGSKWNVLVLAMLPGLAFLATRLAAGRRRLLTSRRGAPVPGIALWEAALLLGALPLATYWLTFLPAHFALSDPLPPGDFIALHTEILRLQSSVIAVHPYQSQWPDWVLNLRAIWYLYEDIDGAQRGIMLIGNPLTMLTGLPALGWAAWTAWRRRRWDTAAVVLLYTVGVGMWAVVDKPVQFYYHYFLPSCFLLAALAMALDALWQSGKRWQRALALAVLAGAGGVFAFWYPILSAAPLAGEQSFTTWAWFAGWR
ncbi:MAG: glycosyltransferase family 39 protein [Parerythrobacter sp.]